VRDAGALTAGAEPAGRRTPEEQLRGGCVVHTQCSLTHAAHTRTGQAVASDGMAGIYATY
jgi:hypothetical protein